VTAASLRSRPIGCWPFTGALLLMASLGPLSARPGVPEHGIAMHGEPVLPENFDHVRYVNPQAPKGGRLTQGVLGTFDSINPFIVKGLALSQIRGYVVESLLARGYDEIPETTTKQTSFWPRQVTAALGSRCQSRPP